MVSAAPPEPADGQDGPPDVRTAVHAVIGYLRDVERHLDPDAAIERRRRVLLAALERLRDHLRDELEHGDPGGLR